MTQKITPVLLCGGSGTRLWPLSRKSYPKQFARLTSDKTMLQETALRVSGADFEDPIVLTSEAFRFIVAEQLEQVGVTPQAIVLEPSSRNTAPAIRAAVELVSKDPDNIMAVMPTDHVIKDTQDFCGALNQAANLAAEGRIVTLGIKPTFPATGYGYIEPASHRETIGAPVQRFIEKPDIATAQKLISNEDMLWNAGLFIFRASDMRHAFDNFAADIVAPVQLAIKNAKSDFGFLRLDEAAWSRCPDISMDYAIMEKAYNVSVVPLSSGWSDLGSWEAIWDESEKSDKGVVETGAVINHNCENTLLRSDDDAVAVMGLGLKDIIVVAQRDAVLVADRSQANEVGNALKELRSRQASQADQARRDHRPWGWFESLAIHDRFQVKQICVKPGGTLSLQSHKYRAEHWIVVEGTAEVTIGEEIKLVETNQSVYVPLGAIHRMRNPGDVNMRLIEIQTGTYFGEDDIIRYEDVYARK
ncbi:MAG: mannose-1-phosphate guanylyltransferase/mannose-6-phosphate isomerase [Pseudomonadota bacterium]